MSHVDDGLLHAYLDGALHAEDPAEAERVERHLAVCDDCRARLEAARGLRAEADALLEGATPAELDMPPFETIAARAAARATKAGVPDPDRPTDAGGGDGVGGTPRRPRRFVVTRTLAWAASIVIALGMGWWARELAYQPGGLPQASMERQEPAQGTAEVAQSLQVARPRAADAAAPAEGAAKAPENEAAAPSAAAEPGGAARNAAGATKATISRQAAAGAGEALQPSGEAGAGRHETGAVPTAKQATAAQQPVAQESAAQRLNALRQQTRAKVAEAPATLSAPVPTGVAERPKAAEPAPSNAADAAFRGLDELGTRRFLTAAGAQEWLGGPVYAVQGLDVVRVVPSAAPSGVRAVTVYQRLSGADTIGLHQQRPASGDAFTLGPGGTGLIRNGTLIYISSTALPPDSVRALLRRLVPLRH
ncbi:MAG: zf-HC2 domain-containing protein [Gemmatimonadota bacterium]